MAFDNPTRRFPWPANVGLTAMVRTEAQLAEQAARGVLLSGDEAYRLQRRFDLDVVAFQDALRLARAS